MMIREITFSDFEGFWHTFADIIQAQETYAFDPTMDINQAYDLWCVTALKSFVFEEDHAIEGKQVLGSYSIRANSMGPSKHICNCGYMVSPNARGKGIARQLCEHSQHIAKDLDFTAMQFNSVVSTNEAAVSLWQKLGYAIIGTIPKAYQHKKLGYVDSYIMHKEL